MMRTGIKQSIMVLFLFIHSFNMYLLSTYYVLRTVLSARGAE